MLLNTEPVISGQNGVQWAMRRSDLRMGVVYWTAENELISAMAQAFEQFGVQTIAVRPDEPLPRQLDFVLACGPFGSLVPIANQILAREPSARPLLALWITEQFANPALPRWFHRVAAETRSYAERRSFSRVGDAVWELHPRWRFLARKACRLRYYGDLLWLQRQGILSVLAVGSDWVANFLRQRSLDPTVAYIGMHPDWGSDLGLERDIPVLWLGKLATDRRATQLRRIEEKLAGLGVPLHVVDGVRNPYVFGDDRTRLLNRTKIVLNVLRTTWDNHSLRYFLAAANRALIVSEPTYEHVPFQPGVHLICSPIEQMTATIYRYIHDDQARCTITANAHDLVTRKLTMAHSARKILDQLLVRQEQRSA